MVAEKFGAETRQHIQEMTRTRLRRALLENNNSSQLRPAPPPNSGSPFSIVSP
jgi:hypothetical protein